MDKLVNRQEEDSLGKGQNGLVSLVGPGHSHLNGSTVKDGDID